MIVRPLWLLDVDGVLNAVTPKPDRNVWADWRSGTARADGLTWPIWFSPVVAQTVRRVHEEGLAEVVWLSTWGHHANGELRTLLDLPELAVAAEPPLAASTNEQSALQGGAPAVSDRLADRWWKYDVVRRLIALDPTRRLLWADDDLRGRYREQEWLRGHADCLLVAPHPQVGLTPRLLREALTSLNTSGESGGLRDRASR